MNNQIKAERMCKIAQSISFFNSPIQYIYKYCVWQHINSIEINTLYTKFTVFFESVFKMNSNINNSTLLFLLESIEFRSTGKCSGQ